jgi:putative ABC transport system permease protein
MLSPLHLAWYQLRAQRLRLLMALIGVAFAVVLMLVQLGIRHALLTSSVRFHARLRADVVLIHPQSRYLVMLRAFPRRRVDQARAFPGVASVSAVYTAFPFWDAGENATARNIFLFAFDPDEPALDLPEVNAHLQDLRRPDRVLFDRMSRPEYGPVAERVARGEAVECELNDRRVQVAGLYGLGTSFGVDGSMVTSDLTFLKVYPGQSPGLIQLGLIRVEPGVNPEALRDALSGALPRDVLALTVADFVAREQAYWNDVTPVGYVFSFGVLLGFAVGSVIVAQILFADVTDHLPDYATLKAMGYGNGYLYGIVLWQSVLLGLLGYLPGLVASQGLCRVAGAATGLPVEVTQGTGLLVLGLTVAMCGVAGWLALGKVRAADPAEIF